MKIKALFFISVISSVLILSSCSSSAAKNSVDNASYSEKVTENINSQNADTEESRNSDGNETETSESEINKMEINVDFFKVPDIYSEFISDEEMNFYRKFVSAWLNYEPKVEFDNLEVTNKLWGMVQECFFVVYGDYDESIGFITDENSITFPYMSDSREEHNKYISDFEERVKSFYYDIDENEKGIDLAKHIYHNFNQTIAYDYDVVDNNNFTFANCSGYTAMMRGSGVCQSFAKAYSYLIRQAGIEGFDVSGLPASNEIEAHEWSALKIDDKYYFADPTWDYLSEPNFYEYFCFGLDLRESNGYPAEKMVLCCNGDIKMSDYVTIERKGCYK